MLNTETLLPLATSVGGGFFAGILVGYFIKKLIKVIMFVVGGIFALLLYLQYTGIIAINMAKLSSSTEWLINSGSSMVSQLDNVNSVSSLGLPLTASMSAGFVLGFIKS